MDTALFPIHQNVLRTDRQRLGSQMQNIRIAHKIRHIAGPGLIVYLIRSPQLFQYPFVHDTDAVRHINGFFLIMGNINKRDTQLFLQPLQFQLHLPAQFQIQCTQRLI